MRCFYSFFHMREYLKHAKMWNRHLLRTKEENLFYVQRARWGKQRAACLMDCCSQKGGISKCEHICRQTNLTSSLGDDVLHQSWPGKQNFVARVFAGVNSVCWVLAARLSRLPATAESLRPGVWYLRGPCPGPLQLLLKRGGGSRRELKAQGYCLVHTVKAECPFQQHHSPWGRTTALCRVRRQPRSPALAGERKGQPLVAVVWLCDGSQSGLGSAGVPAAGPVPPFCPVPAPRSSSGRR